ncbi:MAG: hypothetical protein CUN55_11550 [Phototrophicales bacterium]|nr:MAG: hypothetical protein CUN55_11550 [Phototrophicales bacterium]
MIRHPIIMLLLATSIALAAAIGIVEAYLNLPAAKMQNFILSLTASGIFTMLFAYAAYRYELIRWLPSLHWALVVIIGLAVGLISLNIWVTVQLMFISEEDLIVTTALLIFAGITSATTGIFAASAITKRIQRLSQATDHLANGHFETRLTVDGNDELAAFARRFNWMAESLQQLDAKQRAVEQTRRDLIAGVSHDLRTPLTSIRAMLEAIQDGVVNDEATINRYLVNSLTEIHNLSHLIDDLFQLAQIDAGHIEAQFESASLRDLISDSISSMSAKAARQYIKLTCDIAKDIDPVYMAPDKIQRVLYNLLDNAIRYTPAYGEVTLRAFRQGQTVQVEVHNTGGVIDPTHIPRIFDSFYRGEQSRVQQADGYRSTGLGLAIARRFVEIHRGKIEVDSRPEHGTTFRFTIPRLPHPQTT